MKRTSITIPEEMYKEMDVILTSQHYTVTEFIREALRRHIRAHQQPKSITPEMEKALSEEFAYLEKVREESK